MEKPGKGDPIKDPFELIRLVEERKSVYVEGGIARIPAAIIINWNFAEVMRLINNGIIFYYTPYGYHGRKELKTKIGKTPPLLSLVAHEEPNGDLQPFDLEDDQ